MLTKHAICRHYCVESFVSGINFVNAAKQGTSLHVDFVSVTCSCPQLTSQSVPVQDGDGEFAIKRKGGWDLIHPSKDWVQLPGDVTVTITDLVFPSSHLDVRIRLHVEKTNLSSRFGESLLASYNTLIIHLQAAIKTTRHTVTV